MDINDITVADFKAQFARAFPFLPVYDDTKLYNSGAIVYYPATELFYECILNGTQGDLPTDEDHWKLNPALTTEDFITDEDIERAFAEAKMSFNISLWGDDDSIKLAYLYCAAFWLAYDIKAAQGGIGGASSMPVTSRSVGSVSESYGLPNAYMDEPMFAMYASNPWGLKYLQLALPRIRGNVMGIAGRTLP